MRRVPDYASPMLWLRRAASGVLYTAAILSLLMLIARAARPHVAFLGRVPGTNRYSGLDRNPDNEEVPGALLFRVESSLLYFNVDHVRDTVWRRLRADLISSRSS